MGREFDHQAGAAAGWAAQREVTADRLDAILQDQDLSRYIL